MLVRCAVVMLVLGLVSSAIAESPRKLGIVYWKNGSQLVPLEHTALQVVDKQENGAVTLARGASRGILGNLLAGTGVPLLQYGGAIVGSSYVSATGEAKIRRDVFVTTPASPVRIPVGKPVFTVRSPAFNPQTDSIVQLTVNGDRRGFTCKGTAEGGFTQTNAKTCRMEVEVDPADPMVYLLTPAGTLPPGEYELGPEHDAFCFAIDPTAAVAASADAAVGSDAAADAPPLPAVTTQATPSEVLAAFAAAEARGDAKAAARHLSKGCRVSYLAGSKKISKAELAKSGRELAAAHYVPKKFGATEAVLASNSAEETIRLVKEEGSWRIDLDPEATDEAE